MCIVRHEANSWLEMAGCEPAETLYFQVLHIVRAHTHTHTHKCMHAHNHLGNVKQLQIYFLILAEMSSVA